MPGRRARADPAPRAPAPARRRSRSRPRARPSSGSSRSASTRPHARSGAAASTPNGSRPADAASAWRRERRAEPGEVDRRLRRSARAREAGRGPARDRRPAAHPARRHRRRPVAAAARADAARGPLHRIPRRRRARRGHGEPRRVRAPRRERDVLPDDPGGARERRARWSPPAAAARSTSSRTASTDGSTGRATSPSCATGCATSRATTRSDGRSAMRARRRRARTRMGRARRRAHRPLRGRARRARRRSAAGRTRSTGVRVGHDRAPDGPRPVAPAVTGSDGRAHRRDDRRGIRHPLGAAALAALRRRRRLAHRGPVRHLAHAGGGVPRLGRPPRDAARAREPAGEPRRATRTSPCAAARSPTRSTCSCRCAVDSGADLVSVLIGANDLVGRRADAASARRRGSARPSARLRATGCDVLLVTPFMPRPPASRLFDARFAAFDDAAARASPTSTGAMLLDVRTRPELVDRSMWAEDRVHLNSAGHRGARLRRGARARRARRERARRARARGARQTTTAADRTSATLSGSPPRGAVARAAPARTGGRRRARPEAGRLCRSRAVDDARSQRRRRGHADGSLSGSAALAAELALVVDRAVRLLGAAAAVEVGLALALLRRLVLAVEGLAELALRLVGRARVCSARRKSCVRVCHGCRGRASRTGAAAGRSRTRHPLFTGRKRAALLGW